MSTASFLPLADLLPEALLLVSGSGTVLAANKGAAGRLGLAPDATAGRPLADLVADAPDAVAHYLGDCARSRDLVPGTLRLRGGGPDIPCGCEGTVFAPASAAAPAVLLLRLTPQAPAASAADRRKDEFLAMLAHELRNPLAPLRTGVHILELADDPATVKQVREMMARQVQQLTRLVEDLLDVSRLTRGRITLKQEPVPLVVVLERAVEAARPLLDERRHELTVTLPPRAVRVAADVVRLTQVFVNLLANAARFTEPGGRVLLTSEQAGTERVVRVSDTGVGMTADLLGQVFELFTQAERPLDRPQGGLGVGLSVVRLLVQMHGGSVTAHSDGPGRGSEFAVRLPTLPEASGVA